MSETYSSLWDGLNDTLIAEFWEVDRSGSVVSDSNVVKAPLTEADLEATMNWQSPFEGAGPESSAPTFFSMLKSGAIQPYQDSLSDNSSDGIFGSLLNSASDSVSEFEGRTGITKLNSTQVFNGMPPIKIQVTVLLRAWKDPVSEVKKPFNQLMMWALPKKLGDNGVISNLLSSDGGVIEKLLPSEAPTMIAMSYKGRTYSPLVIESISAPLSSPSDKEGNAIELLLPITLATLTAIDSDDWMDL